VGNSAGFTWLFGGYTSLILRMCRGLLRTNTAFWLMCWALLRVRRALFCICRAPYLFRGLCSGYKCVKEPCTFVLRMCRALLYMECANCGYSQRTAAHCNAWQRTATRCTVLQRTATYCNALQRTATHCNALQNTLELTATHCKLLQRTMQAWSLPK